MKKTHLLSFIVGAIAVASVGAKCSETQVASATDAAGQVCEIVLQATEPQLAPLCVTAADVAKAVEALVAQRAAAAAGDAGLVGAAPYVPSRAEIYAYLVGNGAKPVGQ